MGSLVKFEIPVYTCVRVVGDSIDPMAMEIEIPGGKAAAWVLLPSLDLAKEWARMKGASGAYPINTPEELSDLIWVAKAAGATWAVLVKSDRSGEFVAEDVLMLDDLERSLKGGESN